MCMARTRDVHVRVHVHVHVHRVCALHVYHYFFLLPTNYFLLPTNYLLLTTCYYLLGAARAVRRLDRDYPHHAVRAMPP